jgi:glutathione S-transferase
VILYTCPGGKAAPSWHPCGRAAKALDQAGHRYECKKVGGARLFFWTWPRRARDRAEIVAISGQRLVPILVLDSGSVIAGSGRIMRWARENAPQAADGLSPRSEHR